MTDDEVLNLKSEGKSLRHIASVLGVSHVAILKRLKAIEPSKKVVTSGRGKGLPLATEEKEHVSPGSNAHKSRPSKESEGVVNPVVTRKTPPVSPHQSVNLLKKPSGRARDGEKGVSEGVFPRVEDLAGTINEFLEGKGIQVYRMEGESEAYQVKHNGQVIRFYVQRKQTGASQVPQDG